MNRYVYAPVPNQLDGIMQPINPMMGTRPEGWNEPMSTWFLAGIDQNFSPMIRSDISTPTVDIPQAGNQFAIPALNGGLGAVQDALSVLAVVDLLTKG